MCSIGKEEMGLNGQGGPCQTMVAKNQDPNWILIFDSGLALHRAGGESKYKINPEDANKARCDDSNHDPRKPHGIKDSER